MGAGLKINLEFVSGRFWGKRDFWFDDYCLVLVAPARGWWRIIHLEGISFGGY